MKLLKSLLLLSCVAFLVVQVGLGYYAQAGVFATLLSVASFGMIAPVPGLCSVLTGLIPDVYAALNVVSRELVGAIPSVTRDPRADRCALGATLKNPIAPVNTSVGNVTPAMAFPSANTQTIVSRDFTVQKSRFAPFSWSGEAEYNADSGVGFLTIQQQQIAEAIRAIVNEMEADVCLAAGIAGSRAYGTAGTTAFASDLAAAAQIRKILDDNGAPLSGRSCVMDTTAGAAMRTLSQLTKSNEAGSSMTLRDGELLNIHGISFKESAQIASPAKGSGASYLVNGALSAGATAITVDTGSGTILAGDILTIGNHKYVVSAALAANVVTIAAPGLREAVADNATVTVNNVAARNFAFSQDAILIGTRLPASPGKGDLAIDREIITDDRSGISFEIVAWPGVDMITYHVRAAWGVAVMKPAHIALLLG